MPDERDLAIHDLLLFIVCSLVDYPREVRIESDYAEDGVSFTIRAHSADVGKLVDKQGKKRKRTAYRIERCWSQNCTGDSQLISMMDLQNDEYP